jgi:hypothetical protein
VFLFFIFIFFPAFESIHGLWGFQTARIKRAIREADELNPLVTISLSSCAYLPGSWFSCVLGYVFCGDLHNQFSPLSGLPSPVVSGDGGEMKGRGGRSVVGNCVKLNPSYFLVGFEFSLFFLSLSLPCEIDR